MHLKCKEIALGTVSLKVTVTIIYLVGALDGKHGAKDR